jgi:hypothetical protein
VYLEGLPLAGGFTTGDGARGGAVTRIFADELPKRPLAETFACLQKLPQHATQRGARAMCAHFHFRLRPARQRSDLCDRVTFGVEQCQDELIFGVESREEFRGEVARDEIGFDVGRGGDDLVETHAELLRLLFGDVRLGVLRASSLAAQLVVSGVDGDLREPRGEGGGVRARVSVEREVGFDEGLLHDLLDRLAAREETRGDTRDTRAVTLEQTLERRLVARAHQLHERVVSLLVVRLQN